MSNDDNSAQSDPQSKPMLGLDDEKPRKAHISRKLVKKRYDGRALNGKNRHGDKPGPKPLYLQRKTRNYSSRVLELYDAIASDEQLYTAAWNDGNYELCAQLRREHRDRAYGKAYVAENPERNAGPMPIDPRLQAAIDRLIPGPRVKVIDAQVRENAPALPEPRNRSDKTPVM